jgi:hypothetical protein
MVKNIVMVTCVEIGGFQDNVMANLLGSGDLLVTVSSIIYPFTHSPNGTNAATAYIVCMPL